MIQCLGFSLMNDLSELQYCIQATGEAEMNCFLCDVCNEDIDIPRQSAMFPASPSTHSRPVAVGVGDGRIPPRSPAN